MSSPCDPAVPEGQDAGAFWGNSLCAPLSATPEPWWHHAEKSCKLSFTKAGLAWELDQFSETSAGAIQSTSFHWTKIDQHKAYECMVLCLRLLLHIWIHKPPIHRNLAFHRWDTNNGYFHNKNIFYWPAEQWGGANPWGLGIPQHMLKTCLQAWRAPKWRWSSSGPTEHVTLAIDQLIMDPPHMSNQSWVMVQRLLLFISCKTLCTICISLQFDCHVFFVFFSWISLLCDSELIMLLP